GQQELIPFSVALTSRAQRADGLVVLRARDADGHVLATLRIRVMTVGSVQQFGAGRLPGDQALNNEFALRYLSMNHYQSIFQIEDRRSTCCSFIRSRERLYVGESDYRSHTRG